MLRHIEIKLTTKTKKNINNNKVTVTKITEREGTRLSADFFQNVCITEVYDIIKSIKEKSTTINTLPSKALIPIQWRNKKLLTDKKVKRSKGKVQTTFASNAEKSLSRKEKATTRNKKITTRKVISKGKQTINIGNHPHKDITSKPTNVSSIQCLIL